MRAGPAALTLRPAVRADLPAIGRLGALLVRLHPELDPERFIPAGPRTEGGYAAFLGAQLDNPSVVVIVAERDGEVLGYAYAEVEGHDWMSLRGPAGWYTTWWSTPPSRRTMVEMTREVEGAD